MRRSALDVLACPHCSGPLEVSPAQPGDLLAGTLRCGRDELTYPVVDAVPRLVGRDRVEGVASFADAYSRVWRREGWGGSDPSYLLGLPYRDATGRQSAKWRVKARSMEALLTALDPESHRRVADLGCGVGWLAHRLAERGHDVYAMDVVLDETLGLGAAGVYLREGLYFERVWGELDRPPFRDASMDAVVCNASLHYVPSLELALTAIARILRPGGAAFLLNSPVHRSEESAARAEADYRAHLRELGAREDVASTYHHFTRDGLVRCLETCVGPTSEIPFDPGRGFRLVRTLKGLALRMELASFPIFMARKAA